MNMAAAFVDGKSYGLSSHSDNSSIGGFGNKSIYHVKFTDAFAKAIEEYRTSKGKGSGEKLSIQFFDNQGLLVVPGRNQSQQFQFVTADIKPDDALSSYECIEQVSNGRQECLSVVNEFSKKLTVMATDDVYKSTREKMTIVEQEIKKSGAKEIAMDDPNKGRRIKQPPVRPTSLQKNNSLSVLAVGGQQRSPIESTTPCPTSLVQPTAPSPVGGKTAAVMPVSSLPTSSASGSSLKPLANSAVINYPYRDRVIHLLALRPYKKFELDQVLKRDGLREKDKNTLSTILSQVAVNKNNSYILLRHILLSEVRENWPFYTDENRQYLKRMLESQQDLSSGNIGSTFSSPAVSPCLSNGSGRGSPVSSSSRGASKRPILPDDDVKYQEPPKKQRIAHSQNKSSANMTSEPQLVAKATVCQNNRIKPGLVESQENVNSESSKSLAPVDFKRAYVQIVSLEQRQRYKQDFNAEYDEYRLLYNDMTDRMLIFKRLKEQFAKLTGKQREEVKDRIVSEYRALQADNKYLVRRNRCLYLHSKLGHIKALVDSYDKARLLADASVNAFQC